MMETKGEKIFSLFNYVCLALISFMTLYPFLYVVVASVSDPQSVISGKVLLLPKGYNVEAYKVVLSTKGLWIAYANTVFYTVLGTLTSMIVTICGAYPLSKKRLMGRSFLNFFVAFTMWFHAGIIPFYLNIRSLHLTDNRMGIIIAFACSAFYVILLRTFFQSIPESMEESAKIDGANDWTILLRIILPLSLPSLATIALYYAVDRWNGYFWAMILLKDQNKIPLQVLLKKLIVEMGNTENIMSNAQTYSKETIIYATIVVSVIPIVIVYPYIQKYFVKGIMIGSVKE